MSLAIASAGCTNREPAGSGEDASQPPMDAAMAPEDAFAPVDAYRPPRDAGPRYDVGTAARPAIVTLPTAHDGTTRLPLIVMLHGYGVSPALEDAYLHLSAVTRDKGFYLVAPSGTDDDRGMLDWSDGITGTTGADDVAYLTTILDHAEAMLPIDTSRVYFFGHSSGAFMAYRMACDRADRITAIAVLEGGDYESEFQCFPSRPVSVLHMHGTADQQLPYGGVAGVYAGAVETTQRWARRDSCDVTMSHMPAPFDLDASVDGPETQATDYVTGCNGARVSLFTLEGSSGIPALSAASTGLVLDWLRERTSP
ncbi:MAG: alpha/beta fold hydrolase [Sandaracinus sp.]